MGPGELTHLRADGAARMVDVGAKAATARAATARAVVVLPPACRKALRAGTKKGDVLQIARLAGSQAAKRTAELIPLCHPVRVVGTDVALTLDRRRSRVVIRASVRALDRTGVEMEALTAVTIAALTVYDMCKSADRGMRIVDVQLETKTGGKSGAWRR